MARTDVSSLWFWLANCLFFKVMIIVLAKCWIHVPIVPLYLLMLRNTLWAWTYHRKMCCIMCYGLEGISGKCFVAKKVFLLSILKMMRNEIWLIVFHHSNNKLLELIVTVKSHSFTVKCNLNGNLIL